MGFLLYKLILISPLLVWVAMFALATLVKPKGYRYACIALAFLAFYPLLWQFMTGFVISHDEVMDLVNAGRISHAFFVWVPVWGVMQWLVLGTFVFAPYFLCFVLGLRAGKATPRSQWSAIMKEFG